MRIAIVNDTQMTLEGLKRIIVTSAKHDIAWLAQDGAEAVRLCQQDTPDLILMDLIMPNMDGVEATRQIMQSSPCAILVVTSTVAGNTPQVFEAMGAGALDAVNTPVLTSDETEKGAETLLQKIETIGKLINDKSQPPTLPAEQPISSDTNHSTLIAIGSSTGGPKALAQILGELPSDFSAAIVIIQHVDVQFSHGFVGWLDEQTQLPVRLAKHNETPQPGVVLVADSDKHLAVNAQGKLIYIDEPKTYPYRPSVNVFFSSVAKHWPGNAVGVLLTGMGKDGANGLLEMQSRCFPTIAQNKVSCAVYGMPKAAVDLKAADHILHLSKIAPQICSLLGSAQNNKKAERT